MAGVTGLRTGDLKPASLASQLRWHWSLDVPEWSGEGWREVLGSGVGGAVQVSGNGRQIEVRVDSFVEFCPEQGEQIEQRWTVGFATPLWKRREAVSSMRTELEDAGKQDH